MIENDTEYQIAINRRAENCAFVDHQKAELEGEGYSPEEVARGLGPLLSFQARIAEDVEAFERVKSTETK